MSPLTGVFFLFINPLHLLFSILKIIPKIYMYIYISRQCVPICHENNIQWYICKYKQVKYSSFEYIVTSRERRFSREILFHDIILLRIFA